MALDDHPAPPPPPCGQGPPSVSPHHHEAGDTGQRPVAGPRVTPRPPCDTGGGPALDDATKILRELDPPSTQSLIARVMALVQRELSPGRTLPLDDPTLSLQIAERAASAVLRRAADEVPGVTAASCRLTHSGPSTGVRVRMTLVAGMNRPLPETAGLVRRSVTDVSGHRLGLSVTAVDITVVEIHHRSV